MNTAVKILLTTSGITKKLKDNTVRQQITRKCPHNHDGAMDVAQYIVDEIKTNVRSKTAERIRYHIEEEAFAQRLQEWRNLSVFQQMFSPMPQLDLLSASAIWAAKVGPDADWDHKPKIRSLFKSVAVHRPLTYKSNSAIAESYYHKYKNHDYYLDVWSNIHYGYVGLSMGFNESVLLNGASFAQFLSSLSFDTIDDQTSIKIGFTLYYKFGQYAVQLTAQDILDALDYTVNNMLPNSKNDHWCWNDNNPEKINKPKEL